MTALVPHGNSIFLSQIRRITIQHSWQFFRCNSKTTADGRRWPDQNKYEH